jgi:hypothetical protein
MLRAPSTSSLSWCNGGSRRRVASSVAPVEDEQSRVPSQALDSLCPCGHDGRLATDLEETSPAEGLLRLRSSWR